jgi:hypothetical protein
VCERNSVVVRKEREREGREWRVLNFEYSLFAVLDAFNFGYIARRFCNAFLFPLCVFVYI